MPQMVPQGYTIFGGLKIGFPFVQQFQRRFDAIMGQVGSGMAGVNSAMQQGTGGGLPSRDFGNFGPPGGPSGGTGGNGLPAPPGGPTGGTTQSFSGSGGGGGGIPAPPTGGGGGGGGFRGGGRSTNGAGAGQATGRFGGTNLNNRI